MPNLYETLLIVAPDADDERINAVIGDLRVTVDNDGGQVLQARVWERRKLAYQVKGRSEGIYVIMHADGANTLPAALKQRMKLDESIIRSMVVRLEEPQESDVRAEIETSDHTADDEKIAAQRAAADRRHEAEQAAAALSLEEQVALEEEGAEAGASDDEAGVSDDEAGASDDEAGAAGDDSGAAVDEADAAVDEGGAAVDEGGAADSDADESVDAAPADSGEQADATVATADPEDSAPPADEGENTVSAADVTEDVADESSDSDGPADEQVADDDDEDKEN